ncbi:hypothetical protein RRG08_063782 [Elysia crispata]|uniref:Uncharacterized protein n=1 Tax=Elysia crispata TaxID=231223 RepID=A0AAE1AJV0_9GAST|nr:hypothetical protein RRG08_063782 [Elysia crispata]
MKKTNLLWYSITTLQLLDRWERVIDEIRHLFRSQCAEFVNNLMDLYEPVHSSSLIQRFKKRVRTDVFAFFSNVHTTNKRCLAYGGVEAGER